MQPKAVRDLKKATLQVNEILTRRQMLELTDLEKMAPEIQSLGLARINSLAVEAAKTAGFANLADIKDEKIRCHLIAWTLGLDLSKDWSMGRKEFDMAFTDASLGVVNKPKLVIVNTYEELDHMPIGFGQAAEHDSRILSLLPRWVAMG